MLLHPVPKVTDGAFVARHLVGLGGIGVVGGSQVVKGGVKVLSSWPRNSPFRQCCSVGGDTRLSPSSRWSVGGKKYVNLCRLNSPSGGENDTKENPPKYPHQSERDLFVPLLVIIAIVGYISIILYDALRTWNP
mmetsp:Transcript_9885/g.20103  ORF Transcript_9885/g.20103 Transcript_9885/m.20103 type:complete len:134 (-) Transcript_9885:3453-3854(-)